MANAMWLEGRPDLRLYSTLACVISGLYIMFRSRKLFDDVIHDTLT